MKASASNCIRCACAATGALQADTATPLLRCARCRSTHYVDAARQRAHWPAHRRTCLPLGDGEKERVANLKAPRAFAELAGDLRAGGSARTVALLRRCRVVLDQGAPPGDFEAPWLSLIHLSEPTRPS